MLFDFAGDLAKMLPDERCVRRISKRCGRTSGDDQHHRLEIDTLHRLNRLKDRICAKNMPWLELTLGGIRRRVRQMQDDFRAFNELLPVPWTGSLSLEECETREI